MWSKVGFAAAYFWQNSNVFVVALAGGMGKTVSFKTFNMKRNGFTNEGFGFSDWDSSGDASAVCLKTLFRFAAGMHEP